MKRIQWFLISLFLFVPFIVKAETLTYNVCETCEYNDLNYVFDIISRHYEGSNIDIIINLENNKTYNDITAMIQAPKIQSIIINGNNSTINANSFGVIKVSKIELNDITINTSYNFELSGRYNNYCSEPDNLDEANNKEFLKDTITINNSHINDNTESYFTELSYGTININDTSINSRLLSMSRANVYFHNSNISASISSGYGGCGVKFGTNIHIYSDSTYNKPISRYYASSMTSELYQNLPSLSFVEFEKSTNNSNGNLSSDLANNIYYYQDIDKIVKVNTSISEFESEFINTYEDSIGYDDIKDLPIEWKSNDESIAKLENGIIIPVNAGKVDIIGTRGNDIYTIHLTVEKETIPEKIDKMTIKVPITGSKIKAWVLIVGGILLGIVGTCASMLIKRKK